MNQIDDASLAFGDVELPGVPCAIHLQDYAESLIGKADSAGAVQRAVDRCEGRAEGIHYVGGITMLELRFVETCITRFANERLAALSGRHHT